MNFETLNNGSFKKIAIGITISIFLFSVLILSLSLAKYRSTNSINIAKGTIKYNRPDLHLAEVYVANDSGEYELASIIPESGYVLSEDASKTRCENKDGTLADIIITYENNSLSFSKLTTGGVKCYIYLDKIVNASDKIPEGNPTDDNMFSGIEDDGVYTWTKGDYSGGDQLIKYYRGNVNNNWVVFGKDGDQYIWWRIIRNNSNGSLRMIYAGLSSSKNKAPATTGEGTQIGSIAYNASIEKYAEHAGFKYTLDQVHGRGTNSTILGEENSADKATLYGWYNATLKTNFADKIDIDAGFCNDRQPSTSRTELNGQGGTGRTTTYFAAWIRLTTNKAPTLLCATSDDVFKTPVGLITADEGILGGMTVQYAWNKNSYLYTKRNYWTMTPYWLGSDGIPMMLYVTDDGGIYRSSIPAMVYSLEGVRPVINLKSDTKFVSGNGEASSPFVVQGT